MTNPARRLPLVQVDVFASRPLQGNPLAVFTDARGLADGEMQALAREMNLSETTFVLPRDAAVERERGVRVRIFTVEEELPFAGHPTLGTAFVLRGATGAGEIALDLAVGRVPVRFEERTGEPTFGEMTQAEPRFGAVHEPGPVARATGLGLDDIDPALPTQTVSTGLAFVVVPVRSLAAIRGLKLEAARSADYMARTDAKFFYFVSRETVDASARLHARMIFYNGEDPATGSAAGCASAWMVANGVASPDERVLIEQGLEIRRPSRIFVRAGRLGGKVVDVRVGGHAVEVLRGEVALPRG
jgi:trans-2,3-dihydro-3-hydroxyanthranilate isomerase